MQAPSVSLYVIAFVIGAVCWGVYYLLKKVLPSFQRHAVRYAFFVLTVSAGGFVFFNRLLFAAGLPPLFAYIAVWWLISLFIMLPLLLFWRGLLAAQRRIGKAKEGLSRRDFLCKSAVALPVISFGLSAKGMYEAGEIILKRHSLNFNNFPQKFAGLKIVQISDTHIGPFFGVDAFERALSLAANERPDLVVITGDLIDDLNLLQVTMERLNRFAAQVPYGIYYCWGNHEYFRDRNKIRRALAQSPLIVLENTSCKVIEGESPLYLIGVDYPWAKRGEEMREIRKNYLQQGLEKVPEKAFKILLSHHPDFIEDAFATRIPLTLTGHTHGGQVNIAGHSLLPVNYKYMRGLYRQGDIAGYVSAGTGNWLPFRIGCPPEISVFTLS